MHAIIGTKLTDNWCFLWKHADNGMSHLNTVYLNRVGLEQSCMWMSSILSEHLHKCCAVQAWFKLHYDYSTESTEWALVRCIMKWWNICRNIKSKERFLTKQQNPTRNLLLFHPNVLMKMTMWYQCSLRFQPQDLFSAWLQTTSQTVPGSLVFCLDLSVISSKYIDWKWEKSTVVWLSATTAGQRMATQLRFHSNQCLSFGKCIIICNILKCQNKNMSTW